MRIAMAVGLVLLISSSALGDEKSQQLLESIQGKWERTIAADDGSKLRVVKDIQKDHETLTVFRADEEQPVYAHRVKIAVKATDFGNVFTWNKMEVTAGPNAGAKRDNEGKYVFTIREGTWYEVHGFFPGETRRPSITKYQRVK